LQGYKYLENGDREIASTCDRQDYETNCCMLST